MKTELEYIGDGQWLAGVPARSLTHDEVAAHGGKEALLASGLYREVTQKKARMEPAPEE